MLSSSDHLSTTKRSAADPRRSGPLVDNDSTSKLASATNTTVDATGFEVVDNSGLQINNNEDNISRVNGRGWRCCQPTLVGYSLCEHHLGKGRLRSMTSNTSAKSRSSKKKSNSTNGTKFALGRVEEVEAVEDNSEKKLERMSSFGNNKRVKLGVVKARSLSSLLGQTNSMNIVADHADIQQHEKISSLDYQ
uniref:WRC domain-containing protein n=1 Tax=Chenopodium quinoa TaxID=63459 RepID=A0A803LM43_CHEQI